VNLSPSLYENYYKVIKKENFKGEPCIKQLFYVYSEEILCT